MKGWLDKYNDGGPVQPNYNDASVSMSDDFVGNGYSNVGRNYSPAWGGQFAMGGSMPGAVGFTYARTIGPPAPSKGPYGKKTVASAQNGMEMEYYQNGLDWKPKSISKDGSKIDPSLFIGKNPKTFGKNIAASDKGVNRVMPSDPTKLRVITQAELDAKEAKERRDRINVANAVQPYMWSSPKNFAVATSAIDDKLRISDAPNWFDDNPVNLLRLSGLASGLGQVPLNIQEGNYGQAAMNVAAPVAFGAAETLLTPIVQKATNVVGKGIDYGIKNTTKYNSVNEVVRHALAGVPPERSLPRLTSAELRDARVINELGNMESTRVPLTKRVEYGIKEGLSQEKLEQVFPHLKNQSVPGQGTFGRANPELARLRSEAITPEIESIVMSMPDDIAARGDIEEMTNWTRSQMNSQSSRIDPEALGAVNADQQIVHDAVDYDPGDYGNMTYREWLDMNSQPSQGLASRATEPTYDDIYPNEEYPDLRSYGRPIDPSQPNGPRILGRMDPGTVERAIASRADEPPYSEMYEPIEFNVANEDAAFAAIDDAMRNIPSQETINLTRTRPRFNLDRSATRPRSMDNWTPPKTTSSVVKQVGKGLRNLPENIKNDLLTRHFQEYPFYEGPVETNLGYLTMSNSGSKRQVAREIANAAENVSESGKVYTGSGNTSHNSYLTQLKKQFKLNKENPSEYNPQFLGYHQMNTMGNLSNAGYSKEQIAAFLNSEIDQQVKRGIVPKDIQRPFIKDNQVMLPQYGLKKNEYGGMLDYFEQGGQLTKLDQLTNFTNYNTKQPGGWLDKYQ